jgi:hypothetical protein
MARVTIVVARLSDLDTSCRMTVSEYIRACMLMEMVVDGEIKALKIIGRTIGMKAMHALSRRLKTARRVNERGTLPLRPRPEGQTAPDW